MRWSWLLMLLAAIILSHVHGCKGWLEEEKRALMEIKESLKLHNASMDKFLLPSWVSDPNTDICDWERITCNSSSNQIISLSLYNLTWADEMFNCPTFVRLNLNLSLFLPFNHLTTLNLSSNCFNSIIGIQGSRSKSTFTMLETLDLSHNYDHLKQSITKPLSAMKSLKNLILANCYIDGSFPLQDLSVLPNLEQLDLSTNFLTSPAIEDNYSLPKLKKLKTLDLSDNWLDENIFKYLVAFPALKSLFLSYNFQGRQNDAVVNDKVLANLSNLEVFIIRFSSLNGSFPVQGLCKMMQLQELDLSNNYFTGTLDTCLGNLTSLRALDLSHNYLSGTIPESFMTPLTSLEYLSLSANNFEGSFSFSILANHSKLKILSIGDNYNTKTFQVETENSPWIPSFQLEYLRVSYSQVNLPTITFPSFLFYQQSLKYIDLTNNNIIGMFPNWLLTNNSKLRSVFLDGNSFTGFLLPSNLNHTLDHLQHLKVSNNKFQGTLPINIGYFLPHLEYLDISNNMFDGEIPASIGEMSNLKILDLSNNYFFGTIPKQFLLGCVSLQVLRMSNNSLQGNIFSAPTSLASLSVLIADNNKFNGTLEDGFILRDLGILDISYNNLSGMLPSWIVQSPIGILSVSSNNFEGAIPMDMCKNDIMFLDLSYNRFSNAIPPCLFNSSRYIFLRGNTLTGTLPQITAPLLLVVDVSDNKISGTIPKSFYEVSDLGVLSRSFPKSFSEVPQLRVLLLANNVLEGHISSQICHLKYINFLDLSHNHFTGSIPLCFDNMSFGNYSLSIGGAYEDNYEVDAKYFYPHFWLNEREIFYGHSYGDYEVQFVTKSLSYSYKGQVLENMSGLDLSSNRLEGGIPYQMGNLQALHALNLSHNHLNGTIPESFHNLKEIESLDLSYNYLEGEIPPQLQDLNYLSSFYVCYNNLSGKAPDQGQFANFDDRNYEGNKYLSWSNSKKHIATTPTLQTPLDNTEESESVIDPISFYWSFGVSYVMVLTTLVTVLWINPYWRRVWFYYIFVCLEKSIGRSFEVEFF